MCHNNSIEQCLPLFLYLCTPATAFKRECLASTIEPPMHTVNCNVTSFTVPNSNSGGQWNAAWQHPPARCFSGLGETAPVPPCFERYNKDSALAGAKVWQVFVANLFFLLWIINSPQMTIQNVKINSKNYDIDGLENVGGGEVLYTETISHSHWCWEAKCVATAAL